MANKENIAKVIKHMRETISESKAFNMESVFRETHCGTAACIMGWVGHTIAKENNTEMERSCDIDQEEAAEFLGIDDDQSSNLFYMFDSSLGFQDISFGDAITTLEHLSKTGNVDFEAALGREGDRYVE